MNGARLIGATIVTGCAGLVAVGLASIVIVREANAEQTPTSAAVTEPAFGVPEPTRLDRSTETARWASVRRSTSVRTDASAAAASLGTLDARTPEQTANVVLVKGHRRDRRGELWARVLGPGEQLAARTGWVEASALGSGGVSDARLVINRRTFLATLERGNRVTFRARIGVGTDASPTPLGEFYVRNALTRYASPKYGPIAFGTSAQSTATDWPGGGFIGIHGTNQPGLLPGQVSNGCIRMTNRDIRRLARQLEIGTPVVIV